MSKIQCKVCFEEYEQYNNVPGQQKHAACKARAEHEGKLEKFNRLTAFVVIVLTAATLAATLVGCYLTAVHP